MIEEIWKCDICGAEFTVQTIKIEGNRTRSLPSKAVKEHAMKHRLNGEIQAWIISKGWEIK